MKVKFLKSLLLSGLLLLGGLTGCGGSRNDGTYEVTFKNWNDEVLFVDHVAEGEPAVYEGPTPTRSQDAAFKYTFTGWDEEFKLQAVMEDFSTTAVFKKTPIGVDKDYDQHVKEWSEPGHIYFHYLRTTATSPEDYNKWCIWMWQKKPIDSEGTLWGATEEEMNGKLFPLSASWMEKIPVSGVAEDQAGRIMDINLNLEKEGKMLSGKTKTQVTLSDAKTLGFLISDKTSMDGGTHWTSDGGANSYIDGLQEELKKNNGYAHIYATQGSVGEAKFNYSSEIITNPTLGDESGKYRSTGDLNSSESKYGVSPTSKSFSELGVGYQIFVPSFRDSDGDGIGDIQGIIDALPYLKDLGVEVLWLTPIQQSESYHGYDITDFYKVDTKFGGEEDPDGKYREFIHKAHEAGMKVLMDFVVNHTAKNNIWFKKSQRAEVGTDEFGNKINYRDLFHWKLGTDEVLKYNPDTGNYETVQVKDHGDWYKDGETNYYYYGKFGSNMAELNYDCQATRNLVTSMALYWLGFGVDGFRLDAVKHIYMKDEVETTGDDVVITDVGVRHYYDEEKQENVDAQFDYSSDLTKNVNLWKEFANRLKAVYPDCFLVGENFDGWGNRIAPYYQALDSQFDFAMFFHSAANLYQAETHGAELLTNTHFTETNARFESKQSMALGDTGMTVDGGKRPNFINGSFTSNHDTARMINNMNGKYDKSQGFVDSIPSDCVTGTDQEISRAKVGAAVALLNPGISWIYYGDELGMSGNTDQHIAKYENKNNMDLWYRQPFKWSDETAVTAPKFDKYKIEWDEHNKKILSAEQQQTNAAHDDMFDFFKELIHVKKTFLKGGRLDTNDLNKRYDYIDNSIKMKCMDDLVIYKINTSEGVRNVYINTGKHSSYEPFQIGGHVLAALNGATMQGKIPAYGVLVTKA